MRVVIEGTPANRTSQICHTHLLVLNAGMTERLFNLTFFLVETLGRVHMPVKFRDQLGDVGWLNHTVRKIVVSKHIFQELAFPEITHATSGSRRIEFMSKFVGGTV